MRNFRLVLIVTAGAAGLVGCARGGGAMRVDDQRQPFNRWAAQQIDDEAVAAAVVAQHTLYPYHFAEGSGNLNALGERDVKILARHLAGTPGEVSVRRGGEAQAMYDARVQSVTKALQRFEVPAASIKVVDKMPGGDGAASDRAVLVLRRSMEGTTTTTSTATGSNQNTNQNTNQNANGGGSGASPQGGGK